MPSPKRSQRRVEILDDRKPWGGRRIGIYPRLSDDPTETAAGIERQRQDTIRLAKGLGAAEIVEYVETDTSAWKRRRVPGIDPATGESVPVLRVIRPVWSSMLTDLRSGEIEGAAVYDVDRLVRDPRDLEDVIDIVGDTHRLVKSCSGTLDLTTEDGIAMARVAVVFANKSSAATSRRVTRAHAGRADNGHPVVRGKSQRAYGHSQDGLSIVEKEAQRIVDATPRLISGEATIAKIVSEWNAEGHLTTGGRPWTWGHLWGVLTNPRICGFRSTIINGDRARGERASYYAIHKNADGVEIKGTWEAIISREDWDSLQVAIGGGPLRRSDRTGKASQLLVGVLRCGPCGERLHAQKTYPRHGPSGFKYECSARGCVTVDGPRADVDISARYLASLSRGHVTQTLVESPELDDINRQIAELAGMRNAKVIDVATWARGHHVLMEERRELMAGIGHTRVVRDPQAARRRISEWNGASMEMRRRIVQRWAPDGILVLTTTLRGSGERSYSPDRLVVVEDASNASASSTSS